MELVRLPQLSLLLLHKLRVKGKQLKKPQVSHLGFFCVFTHKVKGKIMKSERELLEFQVLRSITNLYKSFLTLVEDLSEDHKEQFERLKEALPESEDIIRQAEYLDEGQLNYLRKKILDSGNDVRRELFACMENFEIKFKK
jgi:hypothetical protein